MVDTKAQHAHAWLPPQYFVSPKQRAEAIERRQGKTTQKPKTEEHRQRHKVRYAAYVRISSEEQVGNFSMDAQLRAIKAWVRTKKGLLVEVYADEAKSARSTDRPAFQKMRQDARQGRFEALVVHKFDRFARNRTDALAIKSLLRNDYNVKVFSVNEPSEDSDGAIGALIEGIMEAVADWYSRNLGAEVAKGKKERTTQGLHNNLAPFGLTKDENKILIPDNLEYPGLQKAFNLYATGRYSDGDIARILNKLGYRTRRNRRFSKDTVREILKNRTYLGKVRYQKYQRRSDGTRSREAPVKWFDGKHQAVIDEEIFAQCQRIRAERRSHRQSTAKYNPYLLRNLVFCDYCCSHQPRHEVVSSYGKMRPQTYGNGARYYRCRAQELDHVCPQKGVRADILDKQVLDTLTHLRPPTDWRQGVTHCMATILGEEDLESRVEQLREQIRRVDRRWDHGFFLDEQEYLEKRIALQHELESLIPVQNDDLESAAELLLSFKRQLRACGQDIEEQARLVKQTVTRVFVREDKVVGMTMKPIYHLVLNHEMQTQGCTGPSRAEDTGTCAVKGKLQTTEISR